MGKRKRSLDESDYRNIRKKVKKLERKLKKYRSSSPSSSDTDPTHEGSSYHANYSDGCNEEYRNDQGMVHNLTSSRSYSILPTF